MGFPWEFTIPVPGPWQERHSSAANKDGALVDKARIAISTAYIPIAGRQVLSLRTEPRGTCTLRCGFTMGLFAGSNWGKMRIFRTDKGLLYDTPSVFYRLR